MKKNLFVLMALLLAGVYSFSQSPPSVPASGESKPVDIINAEKLRTEKLDSVREIQTGSGNVRARQGNTLFECDSFYYDKSTKVFEAFGNVHINDNDSIDIYSKYLLYHVDTRIANLKNNVRLTDGKSNLTTQQLDYDLNQRIGNYYNGGKVVNEGSVLTSKEATYFADRKDVYFKKNVVLIDPKYKLRADSLLYNSETQLTTFITKTYIEDSARNIVTSSGFYDLKNKKASFGKRPIINDRTSQVIADNIDTNDSTGISILTGNVIYKDSAQGIAIQSDFMDVNNKTGTLLATQRPLLIIKQDKDSLYVTADTLFSAKLNTLDLANDSLSGTDSSRTNNAVKGVAVVDTKSNNDSANRYFKAYHHVRIFSDSLQAVSDSLFYSGKDSIFKLFVDPVMWASNSQVSGDTIYIYTKNKKADRVYVFENGIAVNESGVNMYNQLKGNRMNGYFREGVIDYMRAKGNAESIYYAKDEEQYLVGINRVAGDIIDMRFKDKELNRVVVMNEVKGTMYPVSQIPESEKQLRNFKWQEDRRPKTKEEMFARQDPGP
jgi:lipopolysaccharide export system protein LptA